MTRREVRRDLIVILVVMTVVSVAVNVVGNILTVSRSNEQVHIVKEQGIAQHRSDLHVAAELAYTQKLGDYRSCVGLNKIRSQVRGYIDGVTTRSYSSLVATLNSPTSTTLMKQTSFRNYAGTVVAQQQIHAALPIGREHGADHCKKPAAP